MVIKDYFKGDEEKIIELFELVFNRKMTIEQWRWRFENNPAGKYMIKLMWVGEKLVGHVAVSPIYVKINGEQVLTSHCLATMTHPEYSGKGIFKKLSLALFHKQENELNSKAIWAFPNNNSHYVFVKSLGWKDIAVVHTLGIKPEKVVSLDTAVEILEFQEFNDSHVSFIEDITKNAKVKVDRNLDYLDWRYCQKPSVSYKKFEIKKDGKIVGLIISKVYKSVVEGKFELNLVEVFFVDYNALPESIIEISKLYDLNFERITLWKNLSDPNHIQLEKIGFKLTLPQTYFGSRTVDAFQTVFNDPRNWLIAMGDSDVF